MIPMLTHNTKGTPRPELSSPHYQQSRRNSWDSEVTGFDNSPRRIVRPELHCCRDDLDLPPQRTPLLSPMTPCPSTARTLPPSFSPTVRLNVGGCGFSVMRSTLIRYPDTKLGRLAASNHEDALNVADGYLEDTSEYYFDRSQFTFDWILNLYRTDSLHIAEYRCPQAFLKDLDYWEIEHSLLSPCCYSRLKHLSRTHLPSEPARSQTQSTLLVTSPDAPGEPNSPKTGNGEAMLQQRRPTIWIDPEAFLGQCCGRARRKAWTFVENPTSSPAAVVFSLVSLSFILATIILLIIGSMPSFQYLDPVTNDTLVDPALETGDSVCVIWFSFEYLLRLWCSPSTWDYVKAPLSIIDLIAVMPFYFEILLNVAGVDSKSFGDFRRSILLVRILRLLRVLRVLRVLKVARYSTGFQSMGSTLKRSYKELILLFLFMTTANILFSTMMYFLEWEQPGTKFHSIPAASWWCIITMTTVGYGDLYPTSVPGKILAGIVSISGVILLAFPISVIVENFNKDYLDKQQGGPEDGAPANALAETPHIDPVTGNIHYVPVRKRRVFYP